MAKKRAARGGIGRKRAPPQRERKARRNGSHGQATIADVARFAGVSMSTVSRVMRQPAIVTERLRAKVRAAVERLDYVPNQMATGLAAAKGRQVGVIVPSILNAFFSTTVDALTERIATLGHQVLLGTSDYDEGREEALIESFLSWQPAAIVVAGLRHSRRAARLLLAARSPVIEMWEVGAVPIDYAVGFSHRAVGRAMARHLLARGRRRIAFRGAALERDHRAATRAAGCGEALREAGREPLVVGLPGRAAVTTGCEGLARLLSDHAGVDAICCANDVIALGVLFEAQRRGLAVPDRLAIVGFGDLDFAAHSVPPLTTVRPPARAIGEAAGDIIARAWRGEPPGAKVTDLGFEMVARGTG
jgi:LacI family gluconate utilization system Gnt-I transcriptional repressor